MPAEWEKEFVGAVVRKEPETMKRAIANGLPINEHVLGDDKGMTPLLYAIDSGSRVGGASAVVAVLIAAGADVNEPDICDGERGYTPLMLAARRGDLATIKLLLAAGADIHASLTSDCTALSGCTGSKRPAFEEIMKTFLAAGARPNYQALIGAVRTGTVAMIEMLVAAGADVNEISRWGTPLVLAASSKRDDATLALLRLGADPKLRLPADHRNFPGQTALDIAKKEKAKKVIPILESALAGEPLPEPAQKVLEDVPTLWKRIERALRRSTPHIRKSLRKGASEKELAALEKSARAALPADVKQSYLMHDGQATGADGLFGEDFADLGAEFLLLSVEDVARECKQWKDLLKAGEFKRSVASPDAGIRAQWWNPKWIPFAGDGGGDFLCVDLDPAPGGTPGQVILMHHDSADRSQKAPSLQAFLSALAEHLEEAVE